MIDYNKQFWIDFGEALKNQEFRDKFFNEIEANLKQEERYWKKLFRNVNMSSTHGAAGARTDTNPKLQGRIRKGNQSTSYHEVHITIDDLKEQWDKQNGKCYWLGVDMSLPDLMVSRSPFAPSVDRLDSSGHYTKDNIVLTTRFANLGRGAYDGDDFQERLLKLLDERDR